MEHEHGVGGPGSAQVRTEVHSAVPRDEVTPRAAVTHASVRHYEAGTPGGDSIVAVPVLGLLMLLTWLIILVS